MFTRAFWPFFTLESGFCAYKYLKNKKVDGVSLDSAKRIERYEQDSSLMSQ